MKIYNPIKKKMFNINSSEGINTLKKYIISFKGGADSADGFLRPIRKEYDESEERGTVYTDPNNELEEQATY